jgi:hypothetical protein
MNRARLLVFSLASTGLVLAVAHSGAQTTVPNYCDQHVLHEVQRQKLDPDERYKPRGKVGVDYRCEGTLGQPHKLASIEFSGIWKECHRPQAQAFHELEIAWPAAAAPQKALRVRVQALSQSSKPYLLDTEQPGAQGAFRWPSTLLDVLQIRRDSLGVRVWFPEASRNVYLPVAWQASSAESCTRRYFALFDHVPDASRVFLDARPMRGGQAIEAAFDEEHHGPSAWVELPASLFPAPDAYEVGVRFSDTRRADFTFIHSP